MTSLNISGHVCRIVSNYIRVFFKIFKVLGALVEFKILGALLELNVSGTFVESKILGALVESNF